VKLACVTSLFKYYPLPEALRAIAEAGCTGVELWGGLPHAFTDDFFDAGAVRGDTIAACRRLIAASGLAPVQFLPEQCFYPVNYLISDAPPFNGADLRRRSIAYFERAIAVAAALGFPRMCVTTPFWGWATDGHGWRHAGKQDLAPVIDTLGHLCRVAEREGIDLAIEPLTYLETTGVETLDELRRVLEAVASPRLKVMLDTGHVHVTARALGRDSAAYFAEHVAVLGDRLVHLHLSDNHGDLDAHLNPGQGSFDFPAAARVLRSAGFSGWLSAELIMFGANPVPPRPAKVLAECRAYAERVFGA
jgi:protein FrlC